MMRIFKAIITPLVLFSIIFSPIITGTALAVTKEECEAQNKKYVSGGGYTYCIDPSGAPDEAGTELKAEGYLKDKVIPSDISLKGEEITYNNSCRISPGGLLGFYASVLAPLVALIAGLSGVSALEQTGVSIFSGGTTAVKPIVETGMFLVTKWLTIIMWLVMVSILLYMGGALLQSAIDLNINLSSGTPLIVTGHNIILSIVNIGFVIGLIAIGIMTILRRSNWSAQKTLGNFIVAVILVNFSLFISGLLINISGIFMKAFLSNACAGGLVTEFAVSRTWTTVLEIVSGGSAIAQGLVGIFLGPLLLVPSLALSILGTATIYAILLFLLLRYVMLSVLMIFMPVAWLGFALPQMKIEGYGNPWSWWWKEFTKWLVQGPILVFFFYLSSLILSKSGQLDSPASQGFFNTSIGGILQLLIVMILSAIGLVAALKAGGIAGAVISAGLAGGIGMITKGTQWLGQRYGLAKSTQYREEANRLETESRKARDAGDAPKANELLTKARVAAGRAQSYAAAGVAAQALPIGMRETLERVGLKGLPKEGELAQFAAKPEDAARAWRSKAVSQAGKDLGLENKNEDEIVGTISSLLEQRRRAIEPGQKIILDNKLAAAYKHLSDKGALHKLGEEEFNHLSNADFAQHLAVMGVKVDTSKRYEKAPAETAVKDFNNATSKIEELRRAIPDKEDPRRKQAEDILNSIRVAAAEKLSKPDAFNSLTAGQQTLLTGTMLSSDFRKAVEKKGKSIQEFTDSYVKNIPLDQIADQITTIQGRRGAPEIDDKSINIALASAFARAKKTGKLEDVKLDTRLELVFDKDLRSQMNKMGIDPRSFEGSVGIGEETISGYAFTGKSLSKDDENKLVDWINSIPRKDLSVSAIFNPDPNKNTLDAVGLNKQKQQIQELFLSTLTSGGGKKGGGAMNLLAKADKESFEPLAAMAYNQANTGGKKKDLANSIRSAAQKRGINVGAWPPII